MRDTVRETETRLTEQLASNERTRHALLLRESLQRSLLDAAPVAIVALDSEGRYFLFNQGAERLFGYKAHEFIGRDAPMPDRVGDFAPPLMVPAGFAAMAALRKERGGARMPRTGACCARWPSRASRRWKCRCCIATAARCTRCWRWRRCRTRAVTATACSRSPPT